MTHEQREPLDDLLVDVPAHVTPDIGAAWRAGRRRRATRRIGGALGALVLLVIAGVGTGVLPRPTPDVDPAESRGVSGYPVRIDHSWWVRDLPDAPGPLAGVLTRVVDRGSWGEPVTRYVVSSSGQLWNLPQDDDVLGYPVALSQDGTKLGYLRDRDAYVIRDLVAGTVTVVPDVGNGVSDSEHTYRSTAQMPTFWSPDSSTIYWNAGRTDGADVAALVTDAGARHASNPGGRGDSWPAGWTPDGDLVWLNSNFADRTRWARVVIQTTSGRVVRAVDLKLPAGMSGLSQHSGHVSPDGSEMLVQTGDRMGLDSVFHRFSMETGALLASGEAPAIQVDCSPSWSEDEVFFPSDSGEGAVLVAEDGAAEVVASPRLSVRCSSWASDALSGQRHLGLGGRVFGTQPAWPTWWWRELLGGTALLAAAGFTLRRRRRRGGPGVSG